MHTTITALLAAVATAAAASRDQHHLAADENAFVVPGGNDGRIEALKPLATFKLEYVDMGYGTNVSIGTPPQTVLLHLAMGTATMAVGTEIVYHSWDKHTFDANGEFDPDGSTTGLGLGQQFLEWANDTVWVYEDVVGMGPVRAKTTYILGEVRTVPDLGIKYRADLPPMLPLGLDSPTEPLQLQGVKPHPLLPNAAAKAGLALGLVLHGYPAYPTDEWYSQPREAGQLSMGVDTTKFTGDINYVPTVNTSGFFIPLDGISVDGRTVATGGIAKITLCKEVTGPRSAIAAIYAQIPGARYVAIPKYNRVFPCEPHYEWVFPCDAEFEVGVHLGGRTYTLTAADMIDGVVISHRFARRLGLSPFTGMCAGIFQVARDHGEQDSAHTPDEAWHIGYAFLHTVYTALRYDPPAVGFATLAPGVRREHALPDKVTGTFASRTWALVRYRSWEVVRWCGLETGVGNWVRERVQDK